MANIIESQVTLEDEVFEETIDVAEEPIEVVRPSSYNDLQDLPQINGVTLQGNKSSSDLGIVTQNDINSAVSAEATLRENADTALGSRIDQEITNRGNADTALGGRIDDEITNRTNADNALGTRIGNEILARQGGDNNLQTQIDAITSKSDVVDVVATYADLQAYDTQHLGNNDVIKVLDDETHDHSQTYYRWNKPNSTWTYIGSEAPYYSKSQIDTQMAQKQDKLVAGSNIQIASDGKTISATDTTYTAGNGLNLTGTEFSADTTVLATKTEVAPKLQTEVVAELPTTGEESKLYLTPKNYTTGTATGNPITISLGEDAGQITSAQLDGDTYQQSYTGKNLLNAPDDTIEAGTVTCTTSNSNNFSCSGTVSESWGFSIVANRTTVAPIPAGDYVLSLSKALSFPVSFQFRATSSGSSLIGTKTISAGSTSETFTLSETANIFTFWSTASQNTQINDNFTVQVESGSTVTTYEPYVGGVPSPNPDYPQQIQTVTGTQTVSINGTDYPISLGSIELCKLGTYQDYIYKSGSDWKVHKATKTIYLKDITWLAAPTSVSGKYRMRTSTAPDDILAPADNNTKAAIKSSVYGVITAGDTYAVRATGISVQATTPHIFIYDPNYNTVSSPTAFTQKMATTNATAYYALATATDTTITDTTLISQLEAVRTASLQASNTITNTATGTNLAGDLELGYYEYDPTNRYDKWLWLDLNNNYEKLGG